MVSRRLFSFARRLPSAFGSTFNHGARKGKSMECFSVKRNHLIMCFAFLALVTCAWAQTGTTSLRGTVTDKTGAAIVGASVGIVNQAQGLSRGTTTDGTGSYEFSALPPGSYMLKVESKGFRKFEQKNLQLLVNLP